MTQYECNHHNLSRLLKADVSVCVISDDEPVRWLIVEKIAGTPFTSLSQYGLHKDKEMCDWEILFLEWKTTVGEAPSARTVQQAKPVYYRNDSANREEATIEGHFPADVPVRSKSQKSLDNFVQDSWRTIAKLGFFEKARRLGAEPDAVQMDAGPEVDDGPEMEA
jgi:hypothetical protein